MKRAKLSIMQAELKHLALPNIIYAVGWHKEHHAEELMSDHVLFHILKGELHLREAETASVYKAGETVLVKRNHLVKCGSYPLPEGLPYELLVFILDKKLLQDYALKNERSHHSGSRGLPGVISLAPNLGLKSLFESLEPYRRSGKPLTDAMKRHKLEEAVLALLDVDADMEQFLFDFAEPGKVDLKEFMLRNYMFNIPINKFAELTGRSVSTFQRDFHKLFGMKASYWLAKQRLTAAHVALESGLKRPGEVYLEIGYGDLSNFSRAFKHEYGYSPSFLTRKGITQAPR